MPRWRRERDSKPLPNGYNRFRVVPGRSGPNSPNIKRNVIKLAAFAARRHRVAVVQSGEAEFRELIEKTGSIAVSSTPEELARILAETYEQTSRISREFGLQL